MPKLFANQLHSNYRICCFQLNAFSLVMPRLPDLNTISLFSFRTISKQEHAVYSWQVKLPFSLVYKSIGKEKSFTNTGSTGLISTRTLGNIKSGGSEGVFFVFSDHGGTVVKAMVVHRWHVKVSTVFGGMLISTLQSTSS